MAARVEHITRCLVVRRGVELGSVEVWQSAATADLDFKDGLPTLLQRGSWDTTSEKATIGTESFTVERLSLPPAAHFLRGSGLVITNVHATTLQGPNTQRGEWVAAERVVAQADEQWSAVLGGLLSQLLYAMSTGFINLPRSDPQKAAAQASLSHTAASHSALAARRAAAFKNIPDARVDAEEAEVAGGGSSMAPVVTCSVTLEGDAGEEEDGADEEEGGAEWWGSGQHEPTAVAADQRQSVQWQPGTVATVREGGSDVQAVLDSPRVGLCIINWHAPWVEACLEIVPFMQRLAARFPGAAIALLDVEGSMPNKLLAYEKVLTRSESRRRGAKPVLRSGQHFPCITLHEPSNLVPRQTFCGRDALDELARELAALGPSLTKMPAALAVMPESDQPSAAAPEAAVGERAASSGRASAESRHPADATKGLTVAPGGSPEVAARPSNHRHLKRGAMEFKQILSQAKQAGTSVVVLWTSGSAGSRLDLEKQAQLFPQHTFLEADVTASKVNRDLAGPLQVKSFPLLQVFQNMKLVKATAATEALLAEALAELKVSSARPPPAARVPSSSSQSATTGADTKLAGTQAAVGRDRTYDPPAAPAAAEAKKRLPGAGVCTFWPRMPCLRCGCPWWLGEAWDARCARCKWSAEQEGYDDDSRPLPPFEAKYAEFTALIKEGRTAEWQPGRT